MTEPAEKPASFKCVIAVHLNTWQMSTVMEVHIVPIVLTGNQREKLPRRRPSLVQSNLVIVSSFLYTVTTPNNSIYEPMTALQTTVEPLYKEHSK